MYTKTTAMSAWPVLGAAMAACTLFAGGVAAKEDAVTVSIQVSTQGLDVSQPRGAFRMLRGSPARRVTGSAWRPPQIQKVAVRRRSRVRFGPPI